MNHHSSGRKLLLPLFLAGSILLDAQTRKQPSPDGLDGHRSLESKTAAVQKENPQTVSELYDAVFAIQHYLQLPPEAITLLKPMVVNAEVAYWQGKSKGVSETNIVEAVADLTKSLSLPDFTETSEKQVRRLRFGLMRTSPVFLGKGSGSTEATTGTFKISDRMSPLQAICVTHNLLEQKLFFDSYQITPSEWDAAKTHQSQSQGMNAKGYQLLHAFAAVVNALSYADSVTLFYRVMGHLGVN